MILGTRARPSQVSGCGLGDAWPASPQSRLGWEVEFESKNLEKWNLNENLEIEFEDLETASIYVDITSSKYICYCCPPVN